MDARTVPNRFAPWPAGVEPDVPVPGYPNTWTHTPAQPLFRRPAGRTEATGPLDLTDVRGVSFGFDSWGGEPFTVWLDGLTFE